jgi:hypothetical protein
MKTKTDGPGIFIIRFPRLGKFSPRFSEAWKNELYFFQSLEKSGGAPSNPWKAKMRTNSAR